MNKHIIHEVLEEVASAKTKKEKIKILQDNSTPALLGILRGGFDKSLSFNLPDGAPPYTPLDIEDETQRQRTIRHYVNHFKTWIGNSNVPAYKREGFFLRALETVHPKDAELLLMMKDRKLKGVYKGLTVALVNAAFPELIKES